MNNKKSAKILNRLQNHFSGSRLSHYKRAALWGYVSVVIAVFVGMIYMLTSTSYETDTEADLIAEDEILAVLEGPEGWVSVPISNLEAILPSAATEPAWRAFASDWRPSSKKHIAIVIDDLGLDEDVSKQLALIEGPLTLAFLPYAKHLPEQTKMVRRSGHELLVHLPMEPKNDDADPGPNALVSGVDFAEFERRIEWNLGRFEGFVGINNHMGSALTENPGLMVRLMVHLRKKGYMFLDSLTSPASVGKRAAIATGVPHLERDIFLDNERSIAAILAQLARTEKIATQRGYAIAIGHPYPETMKALQFWLAKLDRNSFSLVPISQLVANNMKAEQVVAVRSQ